MAVAAKYKIYNGSEWVEYTFTPSSHTHSEYAKKQYGIYLVVGNTTGTAGTWTGSNSEITEYYDGLVVNYKIGIAGASTTTLNINGLGAKTCYLRGTTKLTTHYAVGTMVLLAYNATTDAFYSTDYDTNTYTTRQYTTTTNAEYPMLFAYETALPSSYDVKYLRKNSNITANPSTGTVSATIFKEGGTALSSKYATKQQGVYYIEGSGSTMGTWLGSHSEITEYYNGLMIAYKMDNYGSSGNTTTLNINGLGAVAVVRNSTTNIYANHYASGTVLLLIYTTDSSGTAYWKIADYSETDTDKKTSSGATTSKFYLIGATGQSTTGVTTYSRSTAYVDTSGRICGTAGLYTNKMYIPTTSGGTTYGVGSAGQVLTSNGTTCYWGDAPSGNSSGGLQRLGTISVTGGDGYFDATLLYNNGPGNFMLVFHWDDGYTTTANIWLQDPDTIADAPVHSWTNCCFMNGNSELSNGLLYIDPNMYEGYFRYDEYTTCDDAPSCTIEVYKHA